MTLPLDDIRVLDLSHALAGPHCSTLLADYGARVYKLEPPGAGDIARAWGAALPGGESSYFTALHRNKRGLSIDLKSERGRELFLSLVERVDVVLENFRVGALDKLGLGYAAVSARNPRIVYASISGFGQDGPYRDRAALDLVVQAESGMISVTGEEGGRGVRCGVSIADLTAGMYAAFGIMLALHARGRTGRGQHVDVSMLEGQLSLLNVMLSTYLADGDAPRPMGTAYKALLPYQTFRTRTRDIAIAVGSQKLWHLFGPAIGRPEIVADRRFRDNRSRNANRDALVALVQDALLARDYAEWERIFLDVGIPFGALNSFGEVVAHPQVVARGAIVDTLHPRAGRVRTVGVPVRLSDTPGSVRTPSPAIGEHTDEILRELLDLEPQAIAGLRADGVLPP